MNKAKQILFLTYGLLLPLLLQSCGSDSEPTASSRPERQEIVNGFDIFEVAEDFLTDHKLDKQILIVNSKKQSEEKLLLVFDKSDRPLLIQQGDQFKPKVEKVILPDGSELEAPLFKGLYQSEWLIYSKQTLAIQSSNCSVSNVDECKSTKLLKLLVEEKIIGPNASSSEQLVKVQDFPWHQGDGEIAFGTFKSIDRFDSVDYGEDDEKSFFEVFKSCDCAPDTLAPIKDISFASFIQTQTTLKERFLYEVLFKNSNFPLNSDAYFIKYQVSSNKQEFDNSMGEIRVEGFVPLSNFSTPQFMQSYPNGRHGHLSLYKKDKEGTLIPIGNALHLYLDHYKLDPENDFQIELEHEKLNDFLHMRKFKVSASLNVNIPTIYPLEFNLVYAESGPGFTGIHLFSDGLITNPQTMSAELWDDIVEETTFEFYVRSQSTRSFHLAPAGAKIFNNKDDRRFHLKQTIKTPLVHIKPKHLQLECRIQNNQLTIELNSKTVYDFQIELNEISANGDVITQSNWQSGDSLIFTFPAAPEIFNFKINYNNSFLNEVKPVKRPAFGDKFWPRDCGLSQ